MHTHTYILTADIYYVHFPKPKAAHGEHHTRVTHPPKVYNGPESPGYYHYPVGKYTCVCMCVYAYIYIYIYMYVCMCVCTCIYMYVCVYMHIYMCVCVYVCIYKLFRRCVMGLSHRGTIIIL